MHRNGNDMNPEKANGRMAKSKILATRNQEHNIS